MIALDLDGAECMREDSLKSGFVLMGKESNFIGVLRSIGKERFRYDKQRIF